MKRLNFRFADILFFDSYFCFIAKTSPSEDISIYDDKCRQLYRTSSCFHYNEIDHFIDQLRYFLFTDRRYSMSEREQNLVKSTVLNTCEQNRNEFPDEINQIITGFKDWKEHYIVASVSKNNEMLKLLALSSTEPVFYTILDRNDISREVVATIFYQCDAKKCLELAFQYIENLDRKNGDFTAKDISIIYALLSHPNPVVAQPFSFLAGEQGIPNNIKLLALLNPISHIRIEAMKRFRSSNDKPIPQYILELLFAKNITIFDTINPEYLVFNRFFNHNQSTHLPIALRSRLYTVFTDDDHNRLPSYTKLLTEYQKTDMLSLN